MEVNVKKSVLALIVLLLLVAQAMADSTCFVAVEHERVLNQEGSVKKRHSPCSTFKIAISLMGYNEGVLIDELTPEFQFKEG